MTSIIYQLAIIIDNKLKHLGLAYKYKDDIASKEEEEENGEEYEV